MDPIIRTPLQIREKIEGWLLRYENKSEDQFTGNEVFTLFSKLTPDQVQKITDRLILDKFEIPTLILFTQGDSFIVNTTQRFIHISGTNMEAINYADFDHHVGFVSIAQKQKFDKTAIKV